MKQIFSYKSPENIEIQILKNRKIFFSREVPVEDTKIFL